MTCGLGIRTRHRMLKSDPAECPDELEQSEKCMLPECRECLTQVFLFLLRSTAIVAVAVKLHIRNYYFMPELILF